MAIAKSIVPPEWELTRSGIWTYAKDPSPSQLPEAGWKFHVSAIPDHAVHVLDIVARLCVSHATSFKYLVDPLVHVYSMSKRYDRIAAGKFITIYPRTEQHFEAIAPVLAAALSQFDGPFILSDRKHPDSNCLFYRYGTILPRTHAHGGAMIPGPDGYTHDPRGTRYAQPVWISSPISPTDDTAGWSRPPTEIELNDGKYKVTSALSLDPASGTYHGIDMSSGAEVVIKEGRRNLGWLDGKDAVHHIRKEAEICRQLSSLGSTPKYVDQFHEGGNFFFVEEYIDGIPLSQFGARLVPPAIRGVHDGTDHASADTMYHQALTIAWQNLVAAIGQVHEAGWAIGDLNPENILVTPSHDVRLIDLEGFYRPGDGQVSKLSREPYAAADHPIVGVSTFSQDYFGAAASALQSIFPIAKLRVLDPEAWERVLIDVAPMTGVDPTSLRPLLRVARGIWFSEDETDQVKARFRAGPERRTGSARTIGLTHPELAKLERRLADSLMSLVGPTGNASIATGEAGVHADPCSIGHGTAGLLIGAASLRSDDRYQLLESYCRRQEPSDKRGLFDGFAGVGWALDCHTESPWIRALTSARNPAERPDLSVYSGRAGELLALTHAAKRHGLAKHHRATVHAASQLASMASDLDIDSAIPSAITAGADRPTGLLYGRTGIAYALLCASEIVGGDSLPKVSIKLLEDELTWLQEYGSELQLARNADIHDPSSHSPHWAFGSGGLPETYALASNFSSGADDHMRDVAIRCAHALLVEWAASPALGNGLAGFIHGAFSLPASIRTKEHLLMASRQFRHLSSYLSVRNGRIVSPCGDNLQTYSDDLLTGTAGVALVARELRLGTSTFALKPGSTWIQ